VSRAGKSQAAEDLWHLSISDLLATSKESTPLAGHGPVVINLSTSTAQIGPPPKSLRRFDSLHLYQLRRGPEDQPEYLLRLGIIATDIEADAILSSVLEHYPGATKAFPEDDDRAAIAARELAAKQAKRAAVAEPHAPPVPVAPGPREPSAKPGGKAVAKRSEAHRPAAKAAPAEPASVAAAKPQKPARWDIDELLPDLAVTRPSQPKPTDSPAMPAHARQRANPSQPPRPEQSAAPAPIEEARSEARATAPESLDIHVTFDLPAMPTSETVALAVPEQVVEVQAPSAPVRATAQPIEFTLTAPEPAAASLQHVASDIDAHFDSDAITHEVPLPTFEFDAPEIQAPISATPAYEVASTVEFKPAREESPTIEFETTHEEPPTIEVEAARAEPLTAEVKLVHDAAPTIEVEAVHGELPAIEVKFTHDRAPTIEIETTYEEPPTVEVEAAPEEPPTVEVEVAREESPAIDLQFLDVVTFEVRAPELVALQAQIADVVASEPAAPVAPPLELVPDAAAVSHTLHIESTQTLRALTALELDDDQSSPWFSIQLAFSEAQIDPEQIPDLGLFSEYRLYSVLGLHEDRTMHALRLGFFSSELAAEAVAGYLRGYFDAPCIKRVSVAERERFAEESMTARKDIGATGVHAVIELTSPKALPKRQAPVISRGTDEARASIWSRLVAPLKR
jgi:hypothetical protein